MTLPKNFDFTQGNLQNYVDCPYRFYLHDMLRMKWPALIVDDAVDFETRSQTGARFHRLIQQYLTGVPKDRLDELAAEDPNPEVNIWWQNFFDTIAPTLNGTYYVESIHATSLAGYRLVAKYDLVLVHDQQNLTIFDWKTGQKRIRKAWLLEKIQTRFYRFVLARAGSNLIDGKTLDPSQITMNYWFAPHPEAPISLPYTQTDYDSDHDYFFNLINEIAERKTETYFKTSDLKKCHYCIYRSHCDRGIKAGDLADFDETTMDSEIFEPLLDFDTIREIEF